MDCRTPVNLPGRGNVPCGKCLPCLVRRQTDWILRLSVEFKECLQASFVTLTYSDEFVPRRFTQEYSYGVLVKKDVQDFLKRLRKSLEPNRIRYFACGEYGSKTFRPHYHLIIFHPNLDSIHEEINKSWSLGYAVTKHVVPNHFRYVAKYVSTVSDLPKHLLVNDIKPFLLASRRPAIGSSYLRPDMVRYHRETLNTTLRHDGRPYSLPKYYRDRIFDDEMKMVIREVADEYRTKKVLTSESFNTPFSLSNPDLKQIEHEDFERRYKSRVYKNSVI